MLFSCLFLVVASRCGAAGSWEKEVSAIEGRISEPTFRDVSYHVSAYGAVGDGVKDNLAAFGAAIKDANDQGGGTVEVESGEYYLKGSLELLSNVRLRLGVDARLVWSSSRDDYEAVLTKFEGTECFNYAPLLRMYLASNVSIVGAGASSVLDGSGTGWFEKSSDDSDRLRSMADRPVYSRVFGSTAELPPNFIESFGASGVHLENLTIQNSPFWTVHPVASRNVLCRNLAIFTSSTKNSDGIDPEGSVDVLIEDVTFDTGDDCVAVKAGRDEDGRRIARPSENVVVRRCDMKSKTNALCIGSEVSGGVRNVYFYDNKIDGAEVALYFKSNLDRGSFVRDVRVWDIRANDVKKCIDFTNDYHGERGGFFPTDFDGFSISNVDCALKTSEEQQDASALSAVGVDEDHPISNVTLTNISVVSSFDDPSPSSSLVRVEHVSNFDLVDVFVDGVRCDHNYAPQPKPTRSLDDLAWQHMIHLITKDDDNFEDDDKNFFATASRHP